MTSIDKKFLNQLKEPQKITEKYPIFVETGTHIGNTIFALEKLFKQLHTIEIKKELYEKAKQKYKGKKINFHLGDSAIVLNQLTEQLNENTIFFLDGHWSSGDTGQGKKDCPLYEEMESIVSKFKFETIIIIDDFRLFGKGPNQGNHVEDWEDIEKSKILDIAANRVILEYHLPSKYDQNDRFILHLKAVP